MYNSREYRIWEAMKGRCQNPNNRAYRHYGGRGIAVCAQFQTFEGFFAYVGHCPPGLCLDRIDNSKGYEPGNVRWTDQATQMRNTRVNHRYAHDGKNLTLVEWSELTGVPKERIRGRLGLGWPFYLALTLPKNTSRPIKPQP
jgi:hypothetical protein